MTLVSEVQYTRAPATVAPFAEVYTQGCFHNTNGVVSPGRRHYEKRRVRVRVHFHFIH